MSEAQMFRIKAANARRLAASIDNKMAREGLVALSRELEQKAVEVEYREANSSSAERHGS